MSWINDKIAVSGEFKDSDIPLIKEQGITAVLNVRSERKDNEELLKKTGIEYLQLEVDDTYSPSLDQLETALNFIEPLLDNGRKVLIHCQNGCGRSPLVVIAVLAGRGVKIPEAIQLVKQRHPSCGFTDNQTYFLNNELIKLVKARKND